MKLLFILLFTLISSCSSNKIQTGNSDIKVNNCLYFQKQKIFVVDENETDFILYSEINKMKYVYSEKKEKVKKYAIKVNCPKGKKEQVVHFLENHY